MARINGSKSSSGKHYHSENSDSESIRQQVFAALDKNPLLTAKPICRRLNLNYKQHGKYVANLKTAWKYHYQRQRGSKCSSVHGWRGWCFVPVGLDRGVAVGLGWLRTRARNRWLLWKDGFGRLQWFETGRVNLYVRRPASLGRAYQLLCNGFSWTGLITDLKVLQRVLKSVRFKGAHYVFETGQRLPRLTVDLFHESNGIIVKVGDRTHPSSLELIVTYPDWAERNEQLLSQVFQMLQTLNGGVPKKVLQRDPVGVS